MTSESALYGSGRFADLSLLSINGEMPVGACGGEMPFRICEA